MGDIMKTKMSVHFIGKKSRINSHQLLPIYLRVIIDKKRFEMIGVMSMTVPGRPLIVTVLILFDPVHSDGLAELTGPAPEMESDPTTIV